MTRVLVTGASGFIGRNAAARLADVNDCEVLALTRQNGPRMLAEYAAQADFVIHLAGVNRPLDVREFDSGNRGATQALIAALGDARRAVPIIFASSIQAGRDSPYGASKLAAEREIERYGEASGAPVFIFRLPNVFGKWSRPGYNSAVATFCHNVAHGLEIEVHDPAAPLSLAYIDDVVDAFLQIVRGAGEKGGQVEVAPIYRTTVGDIATLIRSFPGTRDSLTIPAVGTGLVRALYSTYLSFLPKTDFAYRLPVHADPRGEFVEMLKTRDSGQFSYFTAKPGITRGGHFHHTKVEKFLVIVGTARFGFRNILTGERHEIMVQGGSGEIVETIPGWAHDITNVGEGELVAMLWANEIFDPQQPDTFAAEV